MEAWTLTDLQKKWQNMRRGSRRLDEMWDEIEEFMRIVLPFVQEELHEEQKNFACGFSTAGDPEHRLIVFERGSAWVRWFQEGVARRDYQLSQGKCPMRLLPLLHRALPRILVAIMEQLPKTREKLEFLMEVAEQ